MQDVADPAKCAEAEQSIANISHEIAVTEQRLRSTKSGPAAVELAQQSDRLHLNLEIAQAMRNTYCERSQK
ncbi:hypothetical protein HY933_04690 [Candidatus Falkowbacteria bacterium]|nr:hypothetical protein [Candidatus Falkowbacteria bacterium]